MLPGQFRLRIPMTMGLLNFGGTRVKLEPVYRELFAFLNTLGNSYLILVRLCPTRPSLDMSHVIGASRDIAVCDARTWEMR